LLTNCASPRQIVIVPSVAMNGGSLQRATSSPFRIPTTRLDASVIAIAKSGLTPKHISVALIMQLMPSTEPIDRSMFPVIST